MKKLFRKFFIIFADFLLFVSAFSLSLWVVGQFGDMPHLFLFVLLAAVCFIACNAHFRLYDSLWEYADIQEVTRSFASVLVFDVSFLMSCFILGATFKPAFYITFFLFNLLSTAGIRASYRLLRCLKRLYRFRHEASIETKNIVVVGAGEKGRMLLTEARWNPAFGRIVAFIDDNPFKHGRRLLDILVVGGRQQIIEVCKRKNAHEIIIALPSSQTKDIKEILDICRQTSCQLKLLPDLGDMPAHSGAVKQVRDVQIEDLLQREPVQLDIEGVAEYLTGKVVLVTGGGGSIGSEICTQVARFNPKSLLILDNYENNAYELQYRLKHKYPYLNMKILIATIGDQVRLSSLFHQYQPQIVFHAAAHKHVPLMEDNPGEAVKNNVFGTLHVAQAANEAGVERVILISTDKAVNPTNVMGATKRIAEIVVHTMNGKSKTIFSAVRFGNVLGSNGSVIPLFKQQILSGGPVTVTHPDITRYFMTIPEASQLVLQAGAFAKGGEIFILDMGEPVKIDTLARTLIGLSGYRPDFDIKIEYTGLRPGEKMYEELATANENLQKTLFDKISLCSPDNCSYDYLMVWLKKLEKLVDGDEPQLIQYLCDFLPSFHCDNVRDREMDELAETQTSG